MDRLELVPWIKDSGLCERAVSGRKTTAGEGVKHGILTEIMLARTDVLEGTLVEVVYT